MTLREASAKTTFCLEHNKDSDILKLKNKHDYYCNSALCTVPKGSGVTATDLHIERIYYNNDFRIKALSKLKNFTVLLHILPEISLSLGPTAIREPTEHFKK